MVILMIQKGVIKSKVMFDLDFIMKRGKILGKALNQQYSALTCRSSRDMHASFVCPRDYEFSCSNSPAIPFHLIARRRGRGRFPYGSRVVAAGMDVYDLGAAAVESVVAEDSPLVGPVKRRVRVTDSPFPLKDDDVDCHVDKQAEEFIERFYMQLRLQKSKAALNHYG